MSTIINQCYQPPLTTFHPHPPGPSADPTSYPCWGALSSVSSKSSGLSVTVLHLSDCRHVHKREHPKLNHANVHFGREPLMHTCTLCADPCPRLARAGAALGTIFGVELRPGSPRQKGIKNCAGKRYHVHSNCLLLMFKPAVLPRVTCMFKVFVCADGTT